MGLATSAYEVDFTKQSSIPSEWTISNWATVKFGSKGAEFTVSKRFESPQLWTNFYIHYGKVEIVAQVAPGTGIVSSAVLMSDDADEIDWEWSGNNFRDSAGKGQNNYYGKGIVGDYDRGSFFSVASPQTQFHTYTIDWTSTALTWSVDGTIVRTLLAANTDSGSHQYPQTPAKFQLGIWAGGDPGNAWGTVDWAGGYTDFTKAPFTMYVKSVKITNYNPAYAYNWTDSSGSSKSIKVVQKPVVSSSSITTMSPPTSSSTSIVISSTQITSTTSISVPPKASTTCAGVPPSAPTQNGIVSGCTQWYTAKSGDTCSKIAAKFSIPIEQFMDRNPAVDAPLCYNMWLNYGYCVSTDCALHSQVVEHFCHFHHHNSGKLADDNWTINYKLKHSVFYLAIDSCSNYTVYRSSDTNWGAYTNVQAKDSFLDCTIACDNDPNCKAYTYVGGKSGSGPGVCWLKRELGEPVPANENVISGSRVTQSVKMRRAVSSWWNSVTSKPTATTTKRVATVKPKAPANPPWARYYPHGGRWMWNGHGEYEWAWN
ncbi:concanavalin A-like lectin/glucanase [Aureobasidium pullulans]|nr:concanavalin A-like lectin/glucanase [Aureobasidium pullulans]